MSRETVISINIRRLDEFSENMQCQNHSSEKMHLPEADDSIFKYRYLVALLEFFAFFATNAYRIATSMSIVAMVNNTAISSHEDLNNYSMSCPLHYSNETNDLLSESNGEFNWSPAIQGYILGAGFLGAVITLMPGGILAEIYGAKRVILSGLLLLTASHLLSPLAAWTSSYLLIAVQLLRGLGEGFIPAAQCVLSANWFPKSERGFLNSLIVTGYPFGALIAAFSSGAMCSSSLFGGWPSVYYIYGILGLVLCFCFYFFVSESPTGNQRISDAELAFILKGQESDLLLKRPPTPWKSILTSVPVYAMTYAQFGVIWVGTHFLSLQPIFFGSILHFSLKQNGLITSSLFIFHILLTFSASWICKFLNSKNYVGVDKVRKGSNFIFCLGYSLCLLGVYYAECARELSAVLSVAAMSFIGFSFSGCIITPLDMSPNFAGTLMGFSSTLGSLSSFIFPVLVGIITDKEQTLEKWNNIFFMCIGITMSSGIFFCVCGSAEVQSWNYPTTKCTDKTGKNEYICKEGDKDLELPIDPVLHL